MKLTLPITAAMPTPYYRARYYSPAIGRFLSRDPLGSTLMMEGVTTPFGSAEFSQGPNLYWYVQNNPANKMDPSGEGVATVAIEAIISRGYSVCAQMDCKDKCMRCIGTVSAANAITIALAVREGIIGCLEESPVFLEAAAEFAGWCIIGVLAARGALFAYDTKEAQETMKKCM